MIFKTYKMEDALESLIDYRGKTPQKSDSGIMTLSAKSVRDGYIDYAQCYYISEDEYNRFMVRGFPKIGDVLLTTEAPLGVTARLDRDDVALAQRLLTIRGKEDVLDTGYLYYYLRSSVGQAKLKERQTGTTVTGIKQAEFRKIEIEIPDIAEQKKIATILGDIDCKIHNNKGINENLQQQAFAFFEQLLSQSKGDFCMLCDIAELNPKRQLVKGVVARCIDMAQLSTSGAFPSGWEMKPYNGGMRFTNGDTIIARITPCLENGKTAFIDFLGDSEVAFGSTEYIVLASKGSYPAEFFYCLARYPAFVDYAVKNMNGSSGRQRVSADTLGKYLLPRISEEEMVIFRNTVTAMFKVMQNNSMENMRLSALRDTLLPRLMSGELDVSSLDI